MEQEQMECLNSSNDEQVRLLGPRAQQASGAATVSGEVISHTEDDVIGQTQWQAIRDAKAAGLSVSAIARQMDLDRKTVRSALSKAEWQRYSRTSRPPRLDEHMDWLRQRAPEVNYLARILHFTRSCVCSAASRAATRS